MKVVLFITLFFLCSWASENTEVKSKDSATSSRGVVSTRNPNDGSTATSTGIITTTDPNSLKVFDDKVLDVGKRVEPGSSSFTTPQGNTFYKAPAANFNSEQKKKAIEACSIEKEKDMASFRNCYNNELAKQIDSVKSNIKSVEKRQSKPYSNIPLKDNVEKKPDIDIEYED